MKTAVPFSLLLSDERIMFPIIHGWMNRHNHPPETSLIFIPYIEIPRNRKTSYTSIQSKFPWHTQQSAVLDTQVKMVRSLKNSVVHFVRKPLSTVILAQKRTWDDIALRYRIFQASCTFVATKVTCRMLCTGAAPPLFRPAK